MPATVPSVIESPILGMAIVTSCQSGVDVRRSRCCKLKGNAAAATGLLILRSEYSIVGLHELGFEAAVRRFCNTNQLSTHLA